MARILVIDDENNIRMMVRIALEQAGHQVDVAQDGPTGLEKFGDGTNYDLVLLDQRMPGMEGLDVLREMRTINSSSRIVIITAFGTIDLAVDAMKAGATDFLRKPFTTETLRGAVIGALMTKPAQEPLQPQPAPVQLPKLVEPGPVLYGLTTVNGYHIESDPKAIIVENGNRRYTFSVMDPNGHEETCSVVLPEHIINEVRIAARKDISPYGERFWHAMCEHVLVNYVYQHANYPPGFQLRVDEVDKSLSKWVRSVVHA